MIHDILQSFWKYFVSVIIIISIYLVLKNLFKIIIGLIVVSVLVWFYFLKQI